MLSGVFTQGVNMAVILLAYPIYLRGLDKDVYGVWLILATVLRFAQLGNLGVNAAIMKLVAEEHGRGDDRGVRQYVTTAIFMLLATGAVILAAILLFQRPILDLFKIAPEHLPEALRVLPWVGLLSVYVILVQTINAALSGLGRMDLSNYCQTAGRVVALLISAFLLWRGWGIMSLLVGNAVSYIVIHLGSILCIRLSAGIRIFSIRDFRAERMSRLLRFGSMVFGSSILAMLFDPFNKMMISRNLGAGAIPLYDIAFHAGVQVRSMIETALRPLMPEISRLSGVRDSKSARRLMRINRQGVLFVLLFAGPLYAVFLAAATPLLRLWLGREFMPDLPLAFRLMLFSTFISLLGVPAYQTLLGLNRAHCSVVSSILICGGNCALVLLIKFVSGTVQVNWIFAGLIFSYFLSTTYLMLQARRAMLHHSQVDNTDSGG
jgi:O-antigen/teichoic acid export membrane protein